ncbi:hypothetical protein D0863_01717 [Hortaea werneckii]|uniref:UCH repeated domain-containing protein n=1 Tax=Hortaea werneckii TaxID=91943 RepID=A0A3M7EJN4_HORWE|nr:hypothetical protein D0863_01717 [Hortaea werneckii]
MAPKKRAATTNTASRTKALKATSPLRISPRKTRPSRKKTEAEETTDIPAPSKVTKAKVSPSKTKTPIKSKATKTAKISPAKKEKQGVDDFPQSNEAKAKPQKPIRAAKKSGATRTQKTSPGRKKSIGEAAYRPEIDEDKDDQDEILGTQKTKKKATKDSDAVTSPPKKRGRPRKNAEVGAGEEVSSPPKKKTQRQPDQGTGVAEASPPKKRGRPKKDTSTEIASAETTETLPKRRGRPPKNASATISSTTKKETTEVKTSALQPKGRAPSKTTNQRPTPQSPPKPTKATPTNKPPSRTTRSVSPTKAKQPSTTDPNPALNRAAVTAAYKYLGLPPRKAWGLPDTAIATAYRDRLSEDDDVQRDDLREALKAIAYARSSATLAGLVREGGHRSEAVQRLLARSPSRRSVSPEKKGGGLRRGRAGSAGSEGLGLPRKRESEVVGGEEWTDSPAKKVRKGSVGAGLALSRGGLGGRTFSVGGVKQSIEAGGGRGGSLSPRRKRSSKSLSPARRVRGSDQAGEMSRSLSPARRAAVPRTGSVSARASPARGRSKNPGTEAAKASSRARSKSAGAGKGYGELIENSIPSLSASARGPSRASRRSPSPRHQRPNVEPALQSKTRSPPATATASQSTRKPRRSPSKSPTRETANRPPPPPPNSRTVSNTTPSERVQVIPKDQPSAQDRGPVHSSTNPQFIPNNGPQQRPNPFFETMPAPEIWHQRMPPVFPFGETPYLERVKSRQIEEDLAYDHSKQPSEALSPEKSAAAAAGGGRGGGGILEQAGQALARIREVFSPKRTTAEQSSSSEDVEKPVPDPYDPVFALPRVREEDVEAFMRGAGNGDEGKSAGMAATGLKRRVSAGSSAGGSRKRRKS